MTDSPESISRNIEVLAEFEAQYREFIHAVEQERRTGVSPWPPQVLAEKRRNISMKAHRADIAAKASGAGYLEVYAPPAVGGALTSDSLPAQVMDFGRVGFGYDEDGLDIPRKILDFIPSQLGALQAQLEEAETTPANTPRIKRRFPTAFGRIRHVPPALGLIADIGGTVIVFVFVGRWVGFW